jgi:hypothetical protein
MFRDLPRDRPDLRPIPKIPPRQPLVYMMVVSEDELDRGHGTLSNQDKQPQPERQKSIIVIEGQNKQQSLDDEDVLCELDGDDERLI